MIRLQNLTPGLIYWALSYRSFYRDFGTLWVVCRNPDQVEWPAMLRGFGLGFSLIAAIGGQNAYLLTRGILRNHHWIIALICSLLDATLIALGIMGMGKLVQSQPGLLTSLTVFGALFLFIYGLFSFRRMLHSAHLQSASKSVSLWTAVTTVLALSLLNPHVYLDTVILIGSISVQEAPAHRLDFGIGAVTASFLWFFCLALGGQWMQRWFQSTLSWRILDAIVGVVMWTLAFFLIRNLLN